MKTLLVIVLLSCASCASTKNIDRPLTRKEIEQDFQKEYNKVKSTRPHKKEANILKAVAFVATVLVFHFKPGL